jgi:hypothetical protein
MSWGEAAQARRDALAALERLMADAPPSTAEEALEALRRVVELRDHLTAQRGREGGSRTLDERLARVNAVLSLVWSGAVPVVGFRRKHLEEAHAALAALAAETPRAGASDESA